MTNYIITWSPLARLSYISILEYLQLNWPEKVIRDFLERTEEVLDHIGQDPHLYPYSKELGSFKCVVVKQVSLFYRIQNDQAELLIFWDNRQEPSKLLTLIDTYR